MDYKGLNVGIIGLGRMGQRHIEVVQKMGMNVCGIVDLSESIIIEVAQKYNIEVDCFFKNAKEMILKARPDALVVATTAPTHAEFTILAAQYNVKYILCEKPISLSLDEAAAMIDACAHYSSYLAINHQMMFLPQYTQIKHIIDELSFGALSSIHVLGSNFGLAMNASHYFEMFRFLTGSNIHTIQAWLENEKLPNPRGAQFEDYSGVLIAQNLDGIKMFIDFSAKAGHGLQVAYIFKYGQIIVDELSGFVRSICRKEEFKTLPTTRYGMPDDIREYQIEPFEMIDSTIMVWKAMFSDSDFPNHEVGLHSLHCLLAAIESHEKNNIAIAVNEIHINPSRKFKWA